MLLKTFVQWLKVAFTPSETLAASDFFISRPIALGRSFSIFSLMLPWEGGEPQVEIHMREQTETKHLPDESETGAFAEIVRKLWEVHSADLQRLQGENQKLRAKIRSLEGDKKLVPSVTLNTEELSGDGEAVTGKKSSLKHQPKSAWARVLPQSKSHENQLTIFSPEPTKDDLPQSFWSLSEKLVSHPMFDIVAAGFIFLNAIVMALESQFQGLSIGADLKYKDLNTGHTETWANAQPVFNIFGYFFGAIFTIELLLKIIGQRLDFFRRDPSNTLDYIFRYQDFDEHFQCFLIVYVLSIHCKICFAQLSAFSVSGMFGTTSTP